MPNEGKIHIGDRVRSLRQRAGLTQQALELAIDTSAGSLSRIESGETNPTKETLGKIADELNLEYRARQYLLGHDLHEITERDIQSAITELQKEIDDHFAPAYIVDYRLNIYYWNRLTTRFFGFSDTEFQNTYPNAIKIVFDPKYEMQKRFSNGFHKIIGRDLLSLYLFENGYIKGYENTLLDLLSGNKEGIEVFEQIKHEPAGDLKNTHNFTISVRTKYGVVTVESSGIIYSKDPRFVLIKYFAKGVKTNILLRYLSFIRRNENG